MSKRYTEEFKTTIIELYKSGKSLDEINTEYGILKSTISTWEKENLPVVSSYEDSIMLKELKAMKKEMARIKEENEILKMLCHTSKELSSVINRINDLKENHNVFLICKVLGVLPRSTYYVFKSKKPSNSSIENTKLKQEIKTIYDESKGIYGAPKIHKILSEKFDISIKRVQRFMKELRLRSIII